MGFQGGASDKEPTCQSRRHKRHRFDPWVWKNPWRRKWQPTQYSWLENPMDRGTWWAIVHGVAKNQAQLKWYFMVMYLFFLLLTAIRIMFITCYSKCCSIEHSCTYILLHRNIDFFNDLTRNGIWLMWFVYTQGCI